MTTSTETMLQEQINHRLEQAIEYARQIQLGEYSNVWTVFDENDSEVADNVLATGEFEALSKIAETWETNGDWRAEPQSFDEPTIVDDYGNEESIYDWPLELVVKIGRPLAVVLTVGGPYVAIEQNVSGWGGALLVGHWGLEKIQRGHDALQTVLDYLTQDLWDEAPEEYK